jgi:hypothetical protein
MTKSGIASGSTTTTARQNRRSGRFVRSISHAEPTPTTAEQTVTMTMTPSSIVFSGSVHVRLRKISGQIVPQLACPACQAGTPRETAP